jgi:hypothetical protein
MYLASYLEMQKERKLESSTETHSEPLLALKGDCWEEKSVDWAPQWAVTTGQKGTPWGEVWVSWD